jgi:hypothetical protein
MGIFVNYPSNIFAAVSNVPQTLVTANTNVLWVTGINVCNRTAAPIRFYLQKVRLQGLSLEKTCVYASTANLIVTYNNGTSGVGATLTNAGPLVPFFVDGNLPSLNTRILIKDQINTFQNGIYTVTTVGSTSTAWVLTRAVDFDTISEIQEGDAVYVSSGFDNANTNWLQDSTVIVIGTSPITFVPNIPSTIYYVNELEISPYSTIDVIDITGILNLQFSITPYLTDKLVCFSNGYTQVFDCEVNYAQLNELPLF